MLKNDIPSSTAITLGYWKCSLNLNFFRFFIRLLLNFYSFLISHWGCWNVFVVTSCLLFGCFVGVDPLCPYPSGQETFFPHEKDCHKFYECFGGRKFELVCPANLFWNQTALSCDYECGKCRIKKHPYKCFQNPNVVVVVVTVTQVINIIIYTNPEETSQF